MSEILESSMRELYYAGDKKNQADNNDVIIVQNITSPTEENALAIRQEHFLHPVNTKNISEIDIVNTYLTLLEGDGENKTAVKVASKSLVKDYTPVHNQAEVLDYQMDANTPAEFDYKAELGGVSNYLLSSNYFLRIDSSINTDSGFIPDPVNILNNYRCVKIKNQTFNDFTAEILIMRRNNVTSEVYAGIFYNWDRVTISGYLIKIDRLGWLTVSKYLNGEEVQTYTFATAIPGYIRFLARINKLKLEAVGGNYSLRIGTNAPLTWTDSAPLHGGELFVGYERNLGPSNLFDVDYIKINPNYFINDDITLFVDHNSFLKYTNELTEQGSVTFYTPHQIANFKMVLTNGGAQTITWTNAKWAGGTAPTLTASGTDIIEGFTYDSGATWYLKVFALNVS